MKDTFLATIGRSGPMGGIRFDEPDATFDAQPALNLLPRILCLPFETMVNICTFNLSERNKDMIVGMLADACCERLEHFITQVRIRACIFLGAKPFCSTQYVCPFFLPGESHCVEQIF